MSTLCLELDDAAQKRLWLRAKWAKRDPHQFAQELFIGQLEVAEFCDGQIQMGCDHLREVVMMLPGASRWQWSGIHHRHWRVGFQLDTHIQPYPKIIKTLAAYLNTDVLQSWGYKPFIFTPEFGADASKEVCWQIETLVSMVDPAEVAEYLKERLPENFADTTVWESFEPKL